MTEFDVSEVRSRFPSLQQDQVFFDNAGGSQILGSVVDSYDFLAENDTQQQQN